MTLTSGSSSFAYLWRFFGSTHSHNSSSSSISTRDRYVQKDRGESNKCQKGKCGHGNYSTRQMDKTSQCDPLPVFLLVLLVEPHHPIAVKSAFFLASPYSWRLDRYSYDSDVLPHSSSQPVSHTQQPPPGSIVSASDPISDQVDSSILIDKRPCALGVSLCGPG